MKKVFKSFFVVFAVTSLLTLFIAASAFAATFNVPTEDFPTVQSAVDAISNIPLSDPTVGPDPVIHVIRLKAGIYTNREHFSEQPPQNPPEGYEDGVRYIKLEAGYDSTFTTRDASANVTIFAGGLDVCCGWGLSIDGITFPEGSIGIVLCCPSTVINNCYFYGNGVMSETQQMNSQPDFENLFNVISNCYFENSNIYHSYGPLTVINTVMTNCDPAFRSNPDEPLNIFNCTIVGNFLVFDRVYAPTTVENSILWGNTQDFRYDDISSFPNITINNSNLDRAAEYGLLNVNGNISEDPMFNPDYTLPLGSPCINAGQPVFMKYPTRATYDYPAPGVIPYLNSAPDIGAFETYVPCDESGVTGSISASPNVLWPPNHDLIPITIDASGLSSANGIDSVSITSVEVLEFSSKESSEVYGENVYDENNFEPDVELTGDLTLNLRSERVGATLGRIYKVTVTATDCSGSYYFTAEVNVPYDMSK